MYGWIQGQDIIEAVFLLGLARDHAYGWIRVFEDGEPMFILAFEECLA